jgi:hypothetical protein
LANSKRSLEGYLLIDHRASVGLRPDQVPSGMPIVPGGATFESATLTCSHCQRVVILNPTRSRERNWCYNCDHYICDDCGLERKLTGKCETYAAKMNAAMEHQLKGVTNG